MSEIGQVEELAMFKMLDRIEADGRMNDDAAKLAAEYVRKYADSGEEKKNEASASFLSYLIKRRREPQFDLRTIDSKVVVDLLLKLEVDLAKHRVPGYGVVDATVFYHVMDYLRILAELRALEEYKKA